MLSKQCLQIVHRLKMAPFRYHLHLMFQATLFLRLSYLMSGETDAYVRTIRQNVCSIQMLKLSTWRCFEKPLFDCFEWWRVESGEGRRRGYIFSPWLIKLDRIFSEWNSMYGDKTFFTYFNTFKSRNISYKTTRGFARNERILVDWSLKEFSTFLLY